MKRKPSKLYYEELGDDFDSFMSEYDVQTRISLISKMLSDVSTDGRCLEIGCGTGRVSEMLVNNFEEIMVSDISQKLSREVGLRLKVDYLCTDACDLGFPDQSFDTIVSSECIEHTPDPIKAIEEMVRVLKPGGTLIFTTPNRLWYPALVVARFLKIRKYAGIENWIYTSSATKLLSAKGMNLNLVTGCHLFPWQIPGAKLILPTFDKLGRFLYPLMINFAVSASKPNGTDTS